MPSLRISDIVFRSNFTWDQEGVTTDEITNRKQTSRTSLLMRRAPEEKIKPGIIQSWEMPSGWADCKVISSGHKRPQKHHSFFAGLLGGAVELFSPAFPSPVVDRFASSSLFFAVYCTISDTRRFDGSSGSSGLRRRWSANPRTCVTWFAPIPLACIRRRAALARSLDSSQLPKFAERA